MAQEWQFVFDLLHLGTTFRVACYGLQGVFQSDGFTGGGDIFTIRCSVLVLVKVVCLSISRPYRPFCGRVREDLQAIGASSNARFLRQGYCLPWSL